MLTTWMPREPSIPHMGIMAACAPDDPAGLLLDSVPEGLLVDAVPEGLPAEPVPAGLVFEPVPDGERAAVVVGMLAPVLFGNQP